NNGWLGVEFTEDIARYIVPKGSITIDGISLTVARWNGNTRVAEVAVIPYTYDHTNICDRKPGDAVDLDGDGLGKYVERYLDARAVASAPAITMSRLLEDGF